MGYRRLPRFIVGALLCLAGIVLVGAASEQPRWVLVACAPGYPGSTEQAQPTMDDFAALVASTAGWPAERLTAEYHPEEATGLERMRDPGAALALVPLPFFLKHESELELTPLLLAVQEGGHSDETWSLVARAGAISTPDDLSGWRLTSIPAYAPGFVRAALASWGELPPDLEIAFGRRMLRAIREAIGGEQVAVLLDRAQVAALPSLPGAEALEVVRQSEPLPAVVLAAIGERIAGSELEAIRSTLVSMHERGDLSEVLGTMRLTRFVAVDDEEIATARAAYRAAR